MLWILCILPYISIFSLSLQHLTPAHVFNECMHTYTCTTYKSNISNWKLLRKELLANGLVRVVSNYDIQTLKLVAALVSKKLFLIYSKQKFSIAQTQYWIAAGYMQTRCFHWIHSVQLTFLMLHLQYGNI